MQVLSEEETSAVSGAGFWAAIPPIIGIGAFVARRLGTASRLGKNAEKTAGQMAGDHARSAGELIGGIGGGAAIEHLDNQSDPSGDPAEGDPPPDNHEPMEAN